MNKSQRITENVHNELIKTPNPENKIVIYENDLQSQDQIERIADSQLNNIKDLIQSQQLKLQEITDCTKPVRSADTKVK